MAQEKMATRNKNNNLAPFQKAQIFVDVNLYQGKVDGSFVADFFSNFPRTLRFAG